MFLFTTKSAFYGDPPPSVPHAGWFLCMHQQLGSLAPACCFPPRLEFPKPGPGRGGIPCDLTLPHVFKASSLGLQDTFPQETKGISAARGPQILFCPHIQGAWRPGTAALLHQATLIPADNTSLSGSAEILTKPSCTPQLRQETGLEYVDNLGSAVEITHLF